MDPKIIKLPLFDAPEAKIVKKITNQLELYDTYFRRIQHCIKKKPPKDIDSDETLRNEPWREIEEFIDSIILKDEIRGVNVDDNECNYNTLDPDEWISFKMSIDCGTTFDPVMYFESLAEAMKVRDEFFFWWKGIKL